VAEVINNISRLTKTLRCQ